MRCNRDAFNRLFEEGAVWIAEPSPAKRAEHAPKSGHAVPFGIGEVDKVLPNGGLRVGCIHELFPLAAAHNCHINGCHINGGAFPPHTILATLVCSALHVSKHGGSFAVWIGKECWPAPYVLMQAAYTEGDKYFLPDLLSRCVFVDSQSRALKLWAIESALHSPAVSVVIALCSKLPAALTQRFSLAAKDGSSLGLIVRPGSEINALSHAATRWGISSMESPSQYPRWELTLLKHKGAKPECASWLIEYRDGVYEKISLPLSSSVASGVKTAHKR